MTSDAAGEYDLLHLQWIGPRSLYYAHLAHKRGRPVALTVHTTPDLIEGAFTMSHALVSPYRRYLRWFIRHVDLLITPSQQATESLRPLAPGKPIHAFSGGIDLDLFSFDEETRVEYRKEHALSRPTVLAVGQLIPRKGIETFLSVARILPDVDFLWIGPRVSPILFYNPRFNNILRNCPANVRFLGFEANIERAYCGCDLFFHPSHAESLGLVILEAAAVGLPLVVRRLPVYHAWLKDGVNCLMGESAREFAAAISTFVFDRAPSISSLEIAKCHSLHTVGHNLIAAYEEVLR
ncbi:MAG: glycosyltransferase family 4 protein [Candidatus Bipolaricaulota bacterium]|nr:glycosyltransferase family 4 protein [Candidatus Bipolaricaulota bacterium]